MDARIGFAAAQDSVELHGETAHRCKGGRVGLERVDFPPLIPCKLSAGFVAQRGRDDREDRVPRFRVLNRVYNLMFHGRTLRFGY